MASTTLEVTIMSGEDLRIGRKPVRNKTFAIVKIDSQSFGGKEIDGQDGSYPFWNRKIVFDAPVDARFLTVEVHCRTSAGDSVLGTANVPMSDFLGRYRPERYSHLLCYRLRDCKGERNGIVNISVRVKAPGSASTSQGRVRVPVAEATRLGCGGDDVVIGIPVWSGYPKKF